MSVWVSAARSNPWVEQLPNLDLMIRGLFLLYIFSLPFTGLLFIERNGFIILCVLLALWCLVNRRVFYRPTPVDMPLLAFLLWVAVTIPFATFPSHSLLEFGKLLKQILVFYAVGYFFQASGPRAWLVRLLLATFFFVCSYGLTQLDFHDAQAMKSFWSAEVWFSTYLVLFLPLCMAVGLREAEPWTKGAYLAMAGIATVCLLFTQSRAGLLALLIELWLLVWFLRRKAIFWIAGLFTLVMLGMAAIQTGQLPAKQSVVVTDSIPIKRNVWSVVHRIDIWRFTLAEIQKHPLVGIGLGKDTFKEVYGEGVEQTQERHAPVKKAGVHNTLLALTLHVGIPGLLLFLWFAGRYLRTVVTQSQETRDQPSQAISLGIAVGTLGLGVRLMFDDMFIGNLAILFWVLAAVALRHHSLESEATIEPHKS